MSIHERIPELQELPPVRRPLPVGVMVGLWLGLGWLAVALVMWAVAPFRSGFLGQLAESPRFVLEVLLGGATSATAVWAAFGLSVPGYSLPRRLISCALLIAAAWAGLVFYGLVEPSLPPSMDGKREHCFHETWIYSVPIVAITLVLIRRRFALDPLPAALLTGVAGAAIPATLMQLACMTVPSHAVSHHLQPVAWVAIAATVAGAIFLPRR